MHFDMVEGMIYDMVINRKVAVSGSAHRNNAPNCHQIFTAEFDHPRQNKQEERMQCGRSTEAVRYREELLSQAKQARHAREQDRSFLKSAVTIQKIYRSGLLHGSRRWCYFET
jgi:hypothetical protein